MNLELDLEQRRQLEVAAEIVNHAKTVVIGRLPFVFERRGQLWFFGSDTDTYFEITYSGHPRYRMYLTVKNNVLGKYRTFAQLMSGSWNWNGIIMLVNEIKELEQKRRKRMDTKPAGG